MCVHCSCAHSPNYAELRTLCHEVSVHDEFAEDPHRGTFDIGVSSICHKLEEEQKITSYSKFFLNLFTVVVRILTQAAFLAHFSWPILPAAVNVDPKEAGQSRESRERRVVGGRDY